MAAFVMRQEVPVTTTHIEHPTPPAVQQRFQELTRLLFTPSETPVLTETCGSQSMCAADFVTSDQKMGRFIVDPDTARLTSFSCQPSYSTVRLRATQRSPRNAQDATAIAREYLEVFSSAEARSAKMVKVSGSPATTWHVNFQLRSQRVLVTLHGPTGALVLLSLNDKKNGFP